MSEAGEANERTETATPDSSAYKHDGHLGIQNNCPTSLLPESSPNPRQYPLKHVMAKSQIGCCFFVVDQS